MLFNRLLHGAAHTCVHIYFHCCFIFVFSCEKKTLFFGHPRSLLTATSFCIAATTFVLSALVHLSTQLVPLFLTVFVAPLFSSIFSVTNEMPVQKKDVMMNEGGDDGAIMGACPMWNLPDEILLSMLAFLPIEDLCNVIRVRLSYQVRIYMEGKDIIQIIFFEYLLKAHFANTFMQFTDSITSHGHVGELVATVGFLSTNEVVYKYDGFVSTTNYSKNYMMLYTKQIQTCRRFHALGTTKVIQSTAKFPAECWPFLSKKETPAAEEGAVPPAESKSQKREMIEKKKVTVRF